MQRSIWVAAFLSAVAVANGDLYDYTLTGTVTSFTDQTGDYTSSIHIGDTYTFSAVLDTSEAPSSMTSWAASYRLVGPTTITIGSFVHQVTQDAASRPYGTFLLAEGPFPDPYSYSFQGNESKGDFTMADGTLASLGDANETGYLNDSSNSAFSSLAIPTSIDVNSFSQRALLYTNTVFDHETDVIDPSTGDLVSTAYYKTDTVVASLDSITIAAVPEPASFFALAAPLLVMGRRRRRYAQP